MGSKDREIQHVRYETWKTGHEETEQTKDTAQGTRGLRYGTPRHRTQREIANGEAQRQRKWRFRAR